MWDTSPGTPEEPPRDALASQTKKATQVQRPRLALIRLAEFTGSDQLPMSHAQVFSRRLYARFHAEKRKPSIQLTEAEWAFRISKDELTIRPIWHHKEERVQAHILVCFLAYVLWKTLAGWMRNAGLGDAPRTLLEELANLQSGDITLAARSPRTGQQRRITLRCVAEPDEAQAVLLRRLGLKLPRRLRRVDEVVPM